jgi:hypothetical protein
MFFSNSMVASEGEGSVRLRPEHTVASPQRKKKGKPFGRRCTFIKINKHISRIILDELLFMGSGKFCQSSATIL